MDAKQELTIILDDCELISDRFNAYQKYELAEHILNYGIIVPLSESLIQKNNAKITDKEREK